MHVQTDVYKKPDSLGLTADSLWWLQDLGVGQDSRDAIYLYWHIDTLTQTHSANDHTRTQGI